jgi:HTH-type transcriptional regulator, sugar sensing transcriptional regulator
MNELEKVGLTENESRVYIELLKLGRSTKTPIAYKSEVSTSKVYDILERLKNKGLVSISIINNIKYFQSSPPEKLNYYLEKKEKEIKHQKQIIENIIPKLNEYITKKEESNIKYYTGKEGLKTAMIEILDIAKEKTTYYGLGITEKKSKMFNINWVHWHKKRANKNINSKLIFSDIENKKYYKELKKIPKTEIKILKDQTQSAIAILDNSVLIVNYSNPPIAIIIENKKICETFKVFFNNIWKVI